jgi:hypothetical protein
MADRPPELRLEEQLRALADEASAPPDLLAGALRQAGRRRRHTILGAGLAVTAVAVLGLGGAPWESKAGPPAPGSRPPQGPHAIPESPLPAGPRPSAAGLSSPPVPGSATSQPASTTLPPQGGQAPRPAPPTVVGRVPRASALVFDGRDVLAVDAASGAARKILRLSAQAEAELPRPDAGSLSPDGTRLAVNSTSLGDPFSGVSGVWVLDLPTGTGHLYPTGGQTIGMVAWSPDSARLWAYRWGGGGLWTLDVPAGTFTAVPGVTELGVYWAGDSAHLVNNVGGWRIVDLQGRLVRPLPQLARFDVQGVWTSAGPAAWSPDGRWLGVQRSGPDTVTFAAVEVSTGRLARAWGPVADSFDTPSVVGWAGPDTMVVLVRHAASADGLQLVELDIRTGQSRVRASFERARFVYLPAPGGR